MFWFDLNEGRSEFIYTEMNDLEINLFIDAGTYQWTDFFPIKGNHIVEFCDLDGNALKVSLNISQSSKSLVLALYPIVLAMNETQYEIQIKDKDKQEPFHLPPSKICCLNYWKVLLIGVKGETLSKIHIASHLTIFTAKVPHSEYFSELVLEVNKVTE